MASLYLSDRGGRRRQLRKPASLRSAS